MRRPNQPSSPIPLSRNSASASRATARPRKGLSAAKARWVRSSAISRDLLEADNGRVGGLLRLGVFAGCLAELLAGLGHVEDVIDDLEGETHVVAEVSQRLELARRCSWRSSPPAGPSNRAGPRSSARECSGVGEAGDLLPLGLEVGHLARNQLERAGGARQFQRSSFEASSAAGSRIAPPPRKPASAARRPPAPRSLPQRPCGWSACPGGNRHYPCPGRSS